MKNVLILSYSDPFLNIPSAMRIGKYAKYLPGFDWKPVVVTSPSTGMYDRDTSFIQDQLEIVSTGSLDIHSLFSRLLSSKKNQLKQDFHRKGEKLYNFIKMLYPVDDKVGWYPYAFQAAEKLIRERQIDLIFTSLGGIYHPAIIAHLLSRKYKIPYVLEFRDLWVDHPFSRQTFYNKMINSHWEKKTVAKADYIITSAPGMKAALISKYPEIENRITVNTNGFDPDDFSGIKPGIKRSDVLNMSFCGSFYKTLNPEDLFRSLIELDNSSVRIELNFIGRFRYFFWKLIKKYESELLFKNIGINILPRLNYKDLIRYLNNSDLFLVFLPDQKYCEAIYPTKIFDYIALKKPILAFCPGSSDLEHFVIGNNLGFTSLSDDPVRGKKVIEEIIEHFKNDRLKDFTADDKFLQQFTRKNITRRLAGIFNDVIEMKNV